MAKRKNNILKKALIFISVFIVLCSACILPVLAQAPNFGNSDFTPSTRYGRTVYCYENNNLVLYLQYDLDRNSNPLKPSTGTIVFSEYYYDNYYTGNIVNDMDILNVSFAIYGTVINAGTIYQSVTSNTSLYTYVSTRDMTQAYLDTVFVVSYENQFTYWENQLIPIQDAFDRGYTQALNDTDAFGRGLAQIFSAPFVFVQNIVGFEIFNISIFEIFSFFLVCALAIFLFRKIRGFLPI